jgi:hypothetical protein
MPCAYVSTRSPEPIAFPGGRPFEPIVAPATTAPRPSMIGWDECGTTGASMGTGTSIAIAGVGVGAGIASGIAFDRAIQRASDQRDATQARMRALTGGAPDADGTVGTGSELAGWGDSITYGEESTSTFDVRLSPDDFNEYTAMRDQWPATDAKPHALSTARAIPYIAGGLAVAAGGAILLAPSMFRASATPYAGAALAAGAGLLAGIAGYQALTWPSGVRGTQAARHVVESERLLERP